MPNPPAQTTVLGARVIALYVVGLATRPQLDSAYAKGWISTADYLEVTSEPEEPEGEPTP